MKVCIFNPPTLTGEKISRVERCQAKAIAGIWPPLELAYIAAVLKQNGFEDVSVVDSAIDSRPFHEIVRGVAASSPDLVVLQDTTPTIGDDITTAKLIKELSPKTEFAFIGLHAAALPQEVLSDVVRFCVRPDPEITVLELCRYLSNHKASEGRDALKDIKGLTFYDAGKIVHNESREATASLDDLPLPAWELVDLKKYIAPINREPFTLIKTSKGCPFECIYCTAQPYHGRRWRARKPEKVVAEIRELVKRHGITNFLFSSDTFNLSEAYVLELCTAIQQERLGVKWMANSRVNEFTERAAIAMKNAGCWLVSFGLESGSDLILTNVRKGATVEQGRRAVDICKKVGLKCMAYFVFGLPGETRETMEATTRFAVEVDPDYAHFYVVTPFPGTKLYEMAEKEGWLLSKDWTRYFHGLSDVIAYPNLSAQEITAACKRAYRSFYYRPSKVAGYLTSIRSVRELLGTASTFWNLFRTWIKG